jgi:hypothetical protein
MEFQSHPWKIVPKPYLKKTHDKKGLMEWLKLWALNSSPSTLPITPLTQGFRDSLHLFSQALQQDLNSLNLFPSMLIQLCR